MLLNFDNIIKNYNLKIKGVLHIGAHYGQEHIEYLIHNIHNIIYFEPLKNNFNVLLKNIQFGETIKAYNIALGNFEGEIDMFVETTNQGMGSSILEPDKHLTQYPGIVFDKKETVLINKLDNIQYDRNLFNLINIDVQGYELEVFKGATKSLEYIDYIITEINRDTLYKNCVQENELDLFLSNFAFVRVETFWAGGTWGDALYIKQ